MQFLSRPEGADQRFLALHFRLRFFSVGTDQVSAEGRSDLTWGQSARPRLAGLGNYAQPWFITSKSTETSTVPCAWCLPGNS